MEIMIFNLFSLVLCRDPIKTVNFEIVETQIITKDENGKYVYTNSYSVTQVPTILKLSQQVSKTRTSSISSSTKVIGEFGHKLYRPEYCIGISSLVLLFICFLYTFCCYDDLAEKYNTKKMEKMILLNLTQEINYDSSKRGEETSKNQKVELQNEV